MVTRGTIVLTATSKTLNIMKEKVNIRTGLVHTNVPTFNSASAFQAAVLGRGREIVLDGWFAGTQAARDTFLGFFEDWINVNNSFQETAKYYPVHYGTTAEYWNVMGADFEYEFDETEPTRILYTLTLREGTKAGIFADQSGEST